jgi:ubiquinone/menaquinone biosynthesis C-methylase UbiE
MNAFERWICGTGIWRRVTEGKVLPWIVSDGSLGERVLEVGAGTGAATGALREKAARVTSLEYDRRLVERLAERHANSGGEIVQGDATALPFAERTFSTVIAILMLHHMKSNALQDRAFAEFYRVLRPGGVFLAFEVADGWLHRAGHVWSTFVPVKTESARARLSAAGFSRIEVESQRGGYRVSARRAGCGEE